MRAPAVLRGLVLCSLVAALVLDSRAESGEGREVLWLGPAHSSSGDSAGTHPPLTRVLTGERVPALVVREAEEPPTPAELETLAAAAEVAPLAVALPAGPPPLRVEPLPELRAGRAASLAFSIRGAPGTDLPVRLLDESGVLDSMQVTIGARGVAEATFRIRPLHEGWREWRVETSTGQAAAGGWVRPERPPRVLLASGPPSVEGRFIARALEESGAQVTVAISLGRELRVGEDAVRALRDHDVVILMPGAELGDDGVGEVVEFITARGGGVLDAGSGAVLRVAGIGAGWSEGEEVQGEEIDWRLPAELVGMPAVPVRGVAQRVVGFQPGAGTVAGAGVHDGAGGGAAADAAVDAPVLALRALGRGRIAALGVRESWRWRLEAGQVEAHREFWRSLVDWLAGGLRDSLLVRLPATMVAPGTTVELQVHVADGATVPELALTRPDGEVELLDLAPARDGSGALRATILPDRPGLHTIGLAAHDTSPDATAERVMVAFRASKSLVDGDAVPGLSPWASLAHLAERSGGVALPAPELEEWLERWRAEHPESRAGHGRPGALLFALIVAAAIGEWALRRLRGHA